MELTPGVGKAQCSRAMMIGLGVLVVLIVVGGVATVIVLAQRQSAEDTPPPSRPADFIAPVSSGGFRFRQADESPEEFKEHIKAANEEFAARSGRTPPTSTSG
jgi:cytoskeletal protein RodZ